MRSKATFLVGLTAFCLGACTSGAANLYRSSNQPRTIEHGQSVTVMNVANETEALPFAEQYCSGRDETAHFERMEMLSYHRIATMGASFSCASQPR